MYDLASGYSVSLLDIIAAWWKVSFDWGIYTTRRVSYNSICLVVKSGYIMFGDDSISELNLILTLINTKSAILLQLWGDNIAIMNFIVLHCFVHTLPSDSISIWSNITKFYLKSTNSPPHIYVFVHVFGFGFFMVDILEFSVGINFDDFLT